MTTTKQIWDEDPVILTITLVSITITLIGDFIKCLLTIHLPKQQQLVVGSTDTTCTLSGKNENQPPSASTNAIAGTVDQKKVGGTTSKDGPSKRSVSSPRSKPSVKQSSSKQKQKNSSDPAETTSDGTHGMLHSPTSTQKRTQRNVRTTADATAHASRQSST